MDVMDEGGMVMWGGGVGCVGEERCVVNCFEMRVGVMSMVVVVEYLLLGGYGSCK